MYSGDDEIDKSLAAVLDYYKVGSWMPERGPLNSTTTNQKLYRIVGDNLVDITFKF